MDSVSHPTNVVMETESAQMAVMNSIAVSTELLACTECFCFQPLVEM